jgi:deoxyribonuclease V
VDVYYPVGGGARAALVLAATPTFEVVLAERVAWLAEVAEYRPGAFVLRELPPIRSVLAVAGPIDLLVIDGYVHLDADGRPGLGAHAHAEFGMPVVGVAKSAFQGADHAVAVRRGGSTRPLYVTAAGLPVGEAADLVARMAGAHRLPDALRRVDALSRGATPAVP